MEENRVNILNLKEQIPHGDILFNLAVHLTEHKTAIDIMLYAHYHDELEILYIMEGNMLLQIDVKAFMVTRGDIVVIPPGIVHGATRCNDSPCIFYAIVFHPSFISSSHNDIIQQSYLEPFFTKTPTAYYYTHPRSSEYGLIYENVKNIIKSYNQKSFGFELFIKTSVLQILHRLLEVHGEEQELSKKGDMTAALRIKRLLIYLEENYNHAFSLADWACSIELSREQFCRIFKRHFNKTPVEYLLNYRISKAAELLIHSRLSIIDIALETGFESANYFTIAFKNKTGTTPSKFRNNHRVGKEILL